MAIDKEKTLKSIQQYALKNQLDKAIGELKKLIEAFPKDIRLIIRSGDYHLRLGDKGKAIEDYLKAAQLYGEEDFTSWAIPMYKKVLSIDGSHLEALHQLANLYEKEGKLGDAKIVFQSILKIKPGDPVAIQGLGKIEKPQPPKESPKRVPLADPPLQRPAFGPEKRFMEDKTVAEASALEAPLPADGPVARGEAAQNLDKDSETHYHLGIAYKEMELFDYAIAEFELAASNHSIRFDCYIMLGNCFMEKGDYNKSIGYYRQATELKGLTDEKLAQLHYSLGLAYEANGMVSEALKTFSHVLALDRSFGDAQERIKKLQQK